MYSFWTITSGRSADGRLSLAELQAEKLEQTISRILPPFNSRRALQGVRDGDGGSGCGDGRVDVVGSRRVRMSSSAGAGSGWRPSAARPSSCRTGGQTTGERLRGRGQGNPRSGLAVMSAVSKSDDRTSARRDLLVARSPGASGGVAAEGRRLGDVQRSDPSVDNCRPPRWRWQTSREPPPAARDRESRSTCSRS